MNEDRELYGVIETGNTEICMHEDDDVHIGHRKIFYISDIHEEFRANKGFSHMTVNGKLFSIDFGN